MVCVSALMRTSSPAHSSEGYTRSGEPLSTKSHPVTVVRAGNSASPWTLTSPAVTSEGRLIVPTVREYVTWFNDGTFQVVPPVSVT